MASSERKRGVIRHIWVPMRFTFTDTDTEVLAEIGRRIAALRLSMNWSQQELAARSGTSKRFVERLEQGSGNPNLRGFIAICSVLRRTPEFEQLLPEIELSPRQIFACEKLRIRASGQRKKVPAKWGVRK